MRCVSPALSAAIYPTDRLGQDHLRTNRLGALWRRNARLLQRNGEAAHSPPAHAQLSC